MNQIHITKRWFEDIQTCGFYFIDIENHIEAFPKLPEGSYPGMYDEAPLPAILDNPHALVDHMSEAPRLAEVGQATLFIDSDTGNVLGRATVKSIQYLPYWKRYAVNFEDITKGEQS